MANVPGPEQQDVVPVTATPASAEQSSAQSGPPAEPPQKQQGEQNPAPKTNNDDNDDDDSDSDLDELDDVLDDFSKPKPAPAQPAPASTSAQEPDFDEDAFLKQLEQDMASMMGNPGGLPGSLPANPSADPALTASVEQGADAFAKQLEESGIPPGDFLKQLLADVMAEEGGARDANTETMAAAAAAAAAAAGVGEKAPESSSDGAQPNESFSDAIQRTMERMKESGDRATEAASTDDGMSDDMIAQLLKAMEAGAAGAGDEGDLTKMFMGMMEQLSNKEMLYEPMKELDGKFGPWLEKNKGEGKVPADDMQRYESQAKIVKQIVQKFEEQGYSDDDPKCREYVWERMQEMQAAGSPPEELVSNPIMEDALGGAAAGGAGGVPDCPQQ